MREMASYREIYTQSLSAQERGSVAEVAAFVDESAYAYLTDSSIRGIAFNLRRELGFLGTPYDLYDVADFDAVCGKYKAVVFLSCVKTPAMQSAVKRARAEKVPYLMPSPQKKSFRTTELRAFCRAQGVHLYSETDDVVYVNAQYVAIHATTAGEKTIRLPAAETLKPLLGETQVTMQGNTAVIPMQKGETILFMRIQTP